MHFGFWNFDFGLSCSKIPNPKSKIRRSPPVLMHPRLDIDPIRRSRRQEQILLERRQRGLVVAKLALRQAKPLICLAVILVALKRGLEVSGRTAVLPQAVAQLADMNIQCRVGIDIDRLRIQPQRRVQLPLRLQ